MNEFRTMEFFLYNYKDLDKMIKDIEKEYIDLISGSVFTWLKSQSEEQNTLEDQVICMIDDNRIRSYRKWQAFLKERFAFLYVNYPKLYKFIIFKYVNKKDKAFIKAKLHMNDIEVKRIRNIIIYWLCENAIEKKII